MTYEVVYLHTETAGELRWLERWIHNPKVGSSILLPATKSINLNKIDAFFMIACISFLSHFLFFAAGKITSIFVLFYG